MSNLFKIKTTLSPSGDQPAAINKITHGVRQNIKDQLLLGVTGSGKTFTMANIIQRTKKSALIMAHNKTLAAQLYEEFKDLFPYNAVEYFVSYYDYYQPEAYIPCSDTYIDKDSRINDQIERFRHSATVSLLDRNDVIVVSSVSSIYGLGDKEIYESMSFEIYTGQQIPMTELQRRLVDLQYKRSDTSLCRGEFNIKGDTIFFFPAYYENTVVKIVFFCVTIESISLIEAVSLKRLEEIMTFKIFSNSHYISSKDIIKRAAQEIKRDLYIRLDEYNGMKCFLEAERLERRTLYDIEMLTKTGTCKGIENYSRYFSGRDPGSPPPTLFDYFTAGSLLFIDESHVMVPQIKAMYRGDLSRKESLVKHGFRLPSALDNRPMTFNEWDNIRSNSFFTVYVSATPGPLEVSRSKPHIAEQIIRPTWIEEPECKLRPSSNQVDDLFHECKKVILKGFRILVTTLTKKMAENLWEYMQENGVKAVYLHSDIKVLDRSAVIRDLRLGRYDVLIGVNLLREGLDIPECGLIAILDADKEGFLRSETSLIQTIGRAARNVHSYVILYANQMTGSMNRALQEVDRRRVKQRAYNKLHSKTPYSVIKTISSVINDDIQKIELPDDIDSLTVAMNKAASELNFELAATIKHKVSLLQQKTKRK